MLKDKKWYVICTCVIGCVLINYVGKIVGAELSLPVWLDSFGTMLAAYILGPVCGALVGLSVNVVYGILYSYTYIIYGVVSVAIGIIVGVCARKGWLDTLFGTLSTSFLVTVVSVVFSTPCNYIFYDGQTGNLWGDGIIVTMERLGINSIVSHVMGQFYLDFLDKVIACFLLFALVKLYRKWNKESSGETNKASDGKGSNRTGKITALFLGMVLAANGVLGSSGMKVCAQEDTQTLDFSSYVQTIYNGENGLPGGMANAIAQTNDGILWIGTYGGLYRYNGSQFRLMDDFESVKNVNCLYTDEAGRLWVGTNDSGLSICINQKIANILDTDDGLGADSVRSITQCADGRYYVGTTGSLSIVTLSGGLSVTENIDEITYASSSTADSRGYVAVTTDAGILYLLKDNHIVAMYDEADTLFTSCAFGDDDTLYVGTSDGRVLTGSVSESGFVVSDTQNAGSLTNIISMNFVNNILYLCADNGAGCIDEAGKYININTSQFNSSLEGMLIDYQGNYWFASSRLGLLRMCRSVFTDVCADTGIDMDVVNSTAKWQGKLYIGMDDGLVAVDMKTGRAYESKLMEELSGTRIRNLMVDSAGSMWIATSGKGIYQVSENETVKVYDESCHTNGMKFRSFIELDDGTVMAAGDSGMTYIKNGKVTGVISQENGLENPKILCLLECNDGSVLAGSDGAGIYRIENGSVTGRYTKSDGITSDVVLRMVSSEKFGGIFIVTSNGLCYMNPEGEIKSLDKFPYYNNYDIVERADGTLFILSSAGIYVVDGESLINGRQLEYTLLDSQTGLLNALTPNCWNYRDQDDNLYMSTDKGVVRLNLEKYDISVRSYRVYVKNIKVDDDMETVERGEPTVIKRGASRIEIMPEIINYSVNDPYVSVWLEGFDKQPKIVRQSELTNVVYTNLDARSYTFHLAVLDSKGQMTVSESTYVIEKEKEIYDHWWFRFYAIFVFCLAVFYLAWLIIRTQIQRTIAMQKKELEFAKSQIAMGNETVLTIARTVDAKDENTSQHSMRVSEYSVKIAKRLGYDDEQCETLRKTALLHDIGKIGIPDSVLNKPARLTDEEYEIMKSHVVKGAEILKKFTLIDNVQEGALYHHERYDGRGYVHGLKGEEIPLNARIIGIADAFDAMTANRVYRKKLDFDFVLGELKKGRGTQFDPHLVDIMLELIDEGEIDVSQLYEDVKNAGEVRL